MAPLATLPSLPGNQDVVRQAGDEIVVIQHVGHARGDVVGRVQTRDRHRIDQRRAIADLGFIARIEDDAAQRGAGQVADIQRIGAAGARGGPLTMMLPRSSPPGMPSSGR